MEKRRAEVQKGTKGIRGINAGGIFMKSLGREGACNKGNKKGAD